MKLKKLLSLLLCTVLCGAMALATTGCSLDMKNPYVDCKTLDEAAKVAGFEITLPTDAIPAGYTQTGIRAAKNLLIEVTYKNGEDTLVLRKGIKGFWSKDISGDYNNYTKTLTDTVNKLSVTFKGESESTLNLATWKSGQYAYAVHSSAAMSKDTLSKLVPGLK